MALVSLYTIEFFFPESPQVLSEQAYVVDNARFQLLLRIRFPIKN